MKKIKSYLSPILICLILVSIMSACKNSDTVLSKDVTSPNDVNNTESSIQVDNQNVQISEWDKAETTGQSIVLTENGEKTNYIFDETDGDVYGFETKTDYELTENNAIISADAAFIISDVKSKNKTDGYEYALHENGYVEITYCNLNQKNIEIPSSLDGHPVGYIGEDAFIYAKPERVIIPEGVMAISKNAFGTTLKSVTLPESLIVLGDYAFYSCGLLERIELKSGLQIIGESCFSRCNSLKEVVIPSNVKVLGRDAFAYCQNLSSIKLNESLKRIGSGCFSETIITEITVPEGIYQMNAGVFDNCTKLKKVTIPKTVGDAENGLGWAMFRGCSNLEEVNLPENIRLIWSETFDGCTSLKSLTIPASVKEIEANNFNNCLSLKDIYFESADCVINPINGFELHPGLTVHAPKGGSVEQFFKMRPLVKFEATD